MLPLTICIDGETIVLNRDSLTNLRVYTLKAIARRFSLKLGGKKSELIDRILDHVTASAACTVSTYTPSANIIDAVVNCFPFSSHFLDRSPLQSCLCGGSTPYYPGPSVECSVCHIKLHAGCMLTTKDCLDFVCPGCRIKLMDPFYSSIDLLSFTYIHQSHPSVRIATVSNALGDNRDLDCYFQSTCGSFNAISLHDWRRANYEIVLRCVLLEPKNTFMQIWPRTMDFRINNTVKSIAAPKSDSHRRDTPIVITPNIKIGNNCFEIVVSDVLSTTTAHPSRSFAFAIILCEPVKIRHFVNNLYEKYSNSFEDHKARAIKALTTSIENDDEVHCVETNCKMNLKCPLTLMPIEIPCRGKDCRHLQCYDMESYFKITQNIKAFNNRWKCPECELITRPENLIMDAYVLKILIETSSQHPPPEVVELDMQGNWKAVSFKEENHQFSDDDSFKNETAECFSSPSPKSLGSDVEVISLDSDSSSTGLHDDRKRQAIKKLNPTSKKLTTQTEYNVSSLANEISCFPSPMLEFPIDDIESIDSDIF